MTKTIEPPDSHFLSAALGWLELGNPAEALVELGQIQPEQQRHPEVLNLRWQVAAAQQNWEEALRLAQDLLAVEPQNPAGWIHQSYALRRIPSRGLPSAWEALCPAADRFPQEPIIPYNLACYAAQMGRTEEAWLWLTRAMKTGNSRKIKKMALTDTDLKSLWARLRESEGER